MAARNRFFAIKCPDEIMKLTLQPFGRHVQRTKVDIEERALPPVPRFEQASRRGHALVKRRAGKRRLNRHLYVVESRLFHEAGDEVEDFLCVAVEAQDETAVQSNAVR